jgi:integrase
MSPFRRGQIWWTRVKDQLGNTKQRSLGTSDKSIAESMEDSVKSIRTQRDWPIINALANGALPIQEVYDAARLGGLDKIRARLSDVDLTTFVSRWERWASDRASESSVSKYAKQVEYLLSAGAMRSDLTRSYVSQRLASLDVSGSTKKRYHAAWSSFFRYLVEIGVIEVNPMRSIQAPKGNPPRDLWLSLADMIRVVDAQPKPFGSLSAFLHGAGVEISAALRVRVRDVDFEARTVRARGTKTATRDRLVRVDNWAWFHVALASADKMPDALLWPLVDGQDRSERHLRSAAAMAFRSLKNALKGLPDLPQGYTLHDARHSYAVRHVKLGTPYKRIAHNLGHADELQVIKVYGKHRLTDQEVANENPEQKANQS